MTVKILALIKSCNGCPNRSYYSGGQYECIKVEQILPQGTVMPDWCPLPAYPKQQTTPTQQDTVLADVRDMLSGALIATGPAQAIMVADAIKLIDAAHQQSAVDQSKQDGR